MKALMYSDKTKNQYILVPICTNYVFIKSGFVTYYHIHPVYHLVFVINGQGYLENDYSKVSLRQKDIFIVNPNEKHIYTSNHPEGMTHYTVNFYLLTFENYKLLDNGIFWENTIDIHTVEALAETAKLDSLFEILTNDIFVDYNKEGWGEFLTKIGSLCSSNDRITKDPYYLISNRFKANPIILSGIYSNFIFSFLSAISGFDFKGTKAIEGKSEYLLIKIVKYINMHLHDSFNLTDLAANLNYSSVYLCSYFKKKAGMTITQYLNKQRINKACEYLRKSDKTITEIALILNFSSSNHFSNSFKKEKKSLQNTSEDILNCNRTVCIL